MKIEIIRERIPAEYAQQADAILSPNPEYGYRIVVETPECNLLVYIPPDYKRDATIQIGLLEEGEDR